MLTQNAMQLFDSGEGLGGAGDFTCGFQKGSYYVCSPKTAAGTAAAKALQRAADAMLGKLPFFVTWIDPETGKPVKFANTPIASSKTGIDGHIGPFSADIIGIALRGAAELRNQADEGLPFSPIVLSAAKETDQQLKPQKLAYNAGELAAFLSDTVSNWDAWLAAAQARFAAKQTKPPIALTEMAVDRNVGLVAPLAPGVIQATKSGQVTPWYRKWWPYAIAAGVVVVGGGTVYYVRRGKTTPAPARKRAQRAYGRRTAAYAGR